MNITGATRVLALIGSPVSHSLSPQIHNRFSDSLGLNYAYLAFDITHDGLKRFTEAARLMGIAGFNVTMPLKERIIPYLDAVSDAAGLCGAVNTVVNKAGTLIGHNTDGDGFARSLEREGFVFNGKKALVLGAGGAARAVALALAKRGMSVRMASRSPDKEVVAEGAEYCNWSDTGSEAEGCPLLVNATPLGMHGVNEDFADLSFLDALPSDSIIYDLIYSPRETALLKAAKGRGLRAINGVPHLVCQAALSFELFTGHTPSERVVSDLLTDTDIF